MLKAKPLPNRDLVQPLSMEDKAVYIARFMEHKQMTDLFADLNQRRQMARKIFAVKWEDAIVTVRTLAGEEFFIE